MKETEKYKGRGIHNPKLLASLREGKLKELLKVATTTNGLDVQLRSDYIDIYYKGGRIITIKSENSADFDEKYFRREEGISPKRSLLEKFKSGDYPAFFCEAASVMDGWFNENRNQERSLQHELSIDNRSGDNTVIDIEYQVSTLSPFSHTGRKKTPRFDIIAVNRQGQLYVIELKYGPGALKGPSGLREHLQDYNDSIGRNPQPFVEEMKRVLTQKQEFGLIDKLAAIGESKPVFMFAYAYDNQAQYDKFNEIHKSRTAHVPCIFLKDKSLILPDQ